MEEYGELLKLYANHKTSVLKDHENRNKAAMGLAYSWYSCSQQGILLEWCKKIVNINDVQSTWQILLNFTAFILKSV
jgi:hypothetical protein